MAVPAVPLTQIGFGRTARRDRWWAQPLLTVAVLGTFVVYTTWASTFCGTVQPAVSIAASRFR